MKKLLLLFMANMLIMSLSAQFKAKMHFKSMGNDRVFTVFSSDAAYRYDFNENGMDGVIIVKKGSPEVVILMPQQKMAMKGSASNPMSMGNDPMASYAQYQEKGITKVEGEETVNGIKCTRAGLYNKDNPSQKMYTIWTSEKYDFPIKLINHIDGSGSSMELKDLEPWTPAPGSFKIPEGYRLMEMPKI